MRSGWQAVDFRRAQAVDPVWLAIFLSLQVLRVWVLMTLGPRWTTRIISFRAPRSYRMAPTAFSHIQTTSSLSERSPLCRFASACLGLLWSSPEQMRSCYRSGPCRKCRADRSRLSNALEHDSPVAALVSTSIGFAMMCVGMFMAILDVRVVATSMPLGAAVRRKARSIGSKRSSALCSAARVSSSCEHGCFHSSQVSTKSDADPVKMPSDIVRTDCRWRL